MPSIPVPSIPGCPPTPVQPPPVPPAPGAVCPHAVPDSAISTSAIGPGVRRSAHRLPGTRDPAGSWPARGCAGMPAPWAALALPVHGPCSNGLRRHDYFLLDFFSPWHKDIPAAIDKTSSHPADSAAQSPCVLATGRTSPRSQQDGDGWGLVWVLVEQPTEKLIPPPAFTSPQLRMMLPPWLTRVWCKNC